MYIRGNETFDQRGENQELQDIGLTLVEYVCTKNEPNLQFSMYSVS